jgi:osmoprotectant transport system ATP-binding protein
MPSSGLVTGTGPDGAAGSASAGLPMISLRDVGKRYPDGTVAVHDLSLDVAEGELVCLIGPSGCGKTTTMKMINRLIEPTSGQIFIDGEEVTQADPVRLRRRIGYVIQQVGLFPHLTVRANVATVPRLLGWPRPRVRTRADELLELVGLDPAAIGGRYPHELSGGQRQRVGVARALAADPPVLLMDEPFSAIDPIARDRLQAEFLRLQAEIRKTVVFVTHDLDEAVRLADRIAVFRQGGHLEQYDTPAHILSRPATPFVADFTGSGRSLLRLAVTPIRREDLLTAPRAAATPDDDGPRPGATGTAPTATAPAASGTWDDSASRRLALGTPLRDALAVLLATDSGEVTVHDGGGRPVGVLTPASLHAAMRRAAAEASPGEPGEPAEPGTGAEPMDAPAGDPRP